MFCEKTDSFYRKWAPIHSLVRLKIRMEMDMRWSKVVTFVGAHAEGEIGRVVTSGVPPIPGATVLDKMIHLNSEDDAIRKFVLFEPRGAAQMTANLLLPPCDPRADAAFIPMQPDGCHAMSGSNAMCVTTVLLETGALTMQEPSSVIVLDTPAGLVTATADCRDGKVTRVGLDFMPSFVEYLDHPLRVDGLDGITVDVAFGGCYFALVDARQVGVSIGPADARRMVDLGTRIRAAAESQIAVRHPELPAMNKIEYLMFVQRDREHPSEFRNATVMAPGRIDRSPCGTGTAARLAVMHARDEIAIGEKLTMKSTIGSRFDSEIMGTATVANRQAIRSRISGRAWIYGMAQIGVDPTDPYPLGFTLSDTWGEGMAPCASGCPLA